LVNLAQSNVRDVLESLRRNVEQVQAIILLGPNGILDYVRFDSALNVETIAGEFGTLLRIAGRTSQDSGAGNLVEHIVVSDDSSMIARVIFPGHFLILISGSSDGLGRARYELRQAAREIQRNR
jgi:predicted regulator of Ras-like GTPase activity (Roadblock/LC7/MglB family)